MIRDRRSARCRCAYILIYSNVIYIIKYPPAFVNGIYVLFRFLSHDFHALPEIRGYSMPILCLHYAYMAINIPCSKKIYYCVV